ncbi:MAG: aminoglycoside phosphotransferase family protein [Actinomycetota bacterium]|nr:aminoglycoside phosphotransferase family protein [Actinomycetota bacterium]
MAGSEPDTDSAFPAAEGSRLAWEDVPAPVRSALDGRFGSPVVRAEVQTGGFSPGTAARVQLRDGRRAFVKAVGPTPNPDSPLLHRNEARVAAAMPPEAPVPRFLFAYDDGEWVALAFEDVDGRHPEVPWRRDELDRVLAAVGELVTSLTPTPVDALPVAAYFEEEFRGWRELAAGGAELDWLDPWALSNLDRLAELEEGWPTAAAGETLLHGDLRADNILVTPDRVVFVDWPHASVGAGWVDLTFMLPSVAMQRGPKPWELFEHHPLGVSAPPDRVDAVVAALAGFFVWRGSLPPPPGIPGVRAFQRAQGARALEWLRHRLGGV